MNGIRVGHNYMNNQPTITESDAQAVIQFVEHIYTYLPELLGATVYGLIVYTIIRLINKYTQ